MSSDTALIFNYLKGRDTVSPAMRRVGQNATAMAAKTKTASTLMIAAYTAVGGAVAGLAAQGVALGSALAPSVGIVAALPAVSVAAVAGVGALAVGMRGLGDAVTGTGEKAAEAYAALSKEGRQLVDVLKALRPQWQGVQRAVQSSLLAGVAGDVRVLAGRWLPMLRTQLVGVADAWNTAFRGVAQTASAPRFVADMNHSLGLMVVAWQRIGAAWAPFLSGFRHFVVVGSAFLPAAGSLVLAIAERFERWAAAARASGRAHAWIRDALTVFGQVWQIVGNVSASIVSVFSAGSVAGFLPGLVASTEAFRVWAASAAGQDRIREFFAALRELGSAVWAVVKPALALLVEAGPAIATVASAFAVVGAGVRFLAEHAGVVRQILPPLVAGFILWRTAMLGAAVAMGVWQVATTIATAAQIAWNIAMALSPIGLVILAIAALVAGIYLLWTNSEGFRKFFIGMWNDHLWPLLQGIGHWFQNDFVGFFVKGWHWIEDAFWASVVWIHDKIQWVVGVVLGIRERVTAAASNLFEGLVFGFKSAINRLIWMWNNFRLTLGGGTVLGVSIPSITLDTPNIPYLEAGGTITRGGAAVVADRDGRGGEVVSLPRGAQVTPLSNGPVQVVLRVDPGSRNVDLATALMKLITFEVKARGGNVQKALGR